LGCISGGVLSAAGCCQWRGAVSGAVLSAAAHSHNFTSNEPAAAVESFAGIEEPPIERHAHRTPAISGAPQFRQSAAGGWTPQSFCLLDPLHKCLEFILAAVSHKYVCYANLIEKKGFSKVKVPYWSELVK
jgi:hypothetical protein